MALERQDFLYEILFRFGPEGLTGAHQQTLTRYTDDGTVISDNVGDAVPLTLEAAADLVDAQVPEMAAQIVQLRGEVQELTEQCDGLKGVNGGLRAERDALAAQVIEVVILPGENMPDAAAAITAFSSLARRSIKVEMNGTPLLVKPGETAAAVLQKWQQDRGAAAPS